jgi:hypothetical protein
MHTATELFGNSIQCLIRVAAEQGFAVDVALMPLLLTLKEPAFGWRLYWFAG